MFGAKAGDGKLAAPVMPDLYAALSVLDASWTPLGTPSTSPRRVAMEPAEGGPGARANWFYSQRAYPLQHVPDGARQKALAQAAKIDEIQGRAKASSGSLWTSVGPAGYSFISGANTTWGQMSGRVRALAIDPNNSSRLLLGTASGGAWLSTNTGASWTPLTDDQPSLSVGAVAIDPNNSNVFYVGTGEGNGTYYGAGILKSVDGGSSWTVLGAELFSRGAISDILISPNDSNLIVVCARNGTLLTVEPVGALIGGIYRSTDGGQTFTRTALNNCHGLKAVWTDFNVMYQSATSIPERGLYRSIDAGATWNLVSGAINGGDVERLAFGLSNDGSKIYLGGKKGTDIVTQNSSDGGQTWSAPVLTPLPDPMSFDPGNPLTYCESQCDYDNVISVNPFDPNDVIFAGVGSYRTRDGGMSAERIGENNSGGGPLHVDHHVALYDRNMQGVVYSGNDGGIYRSSDGGASWTSIGGGIASLQHYHVSLHPTDRNIFISGNQDNGNTRRTSSNFWDGIGGGDGSYSAIDFNNPQIIYISTQNLKIDKSTDGGNSFPNNFVFEPPQGEPVGFIAPFVMDPSNSSVLHAGTNRLHSTSNGGMNWVPGSVLTAIDGAVITHIALAPSDTSVIYTTGSDGSVSRTANGSSAIISNSSLPGRYATAVAVHPTAPNTVYVGFSGFNDATAQTPGHIFKTTDGGGGWSNVSANLPDTPVNTLAIRPDQPDEIYAGTDVGVFISLDGGGSWAKMNNGLPNVAVANLAVNPTTNLLAAATYGRSVWVTDLNGGGGGGGGDDHGDSCAAASAAAVGSTLNGVLAPNTDVDYFRFELSGSATVTAEADSQFDSFGILYDASCVEIARDDDGPDGDNNRNFRIERMLSAGTYFLQVSSFMGQTGGGYQVALASSGGGGGGGVPLSGATSGTYISDGLRNHGFFLTVAPKADGSNFIFYAWFTYDNDGVPTWLIGQQDIAANSASVSTNALAFTGAFPGGPRFLNFNDVAAMSSTRGTLNFTQRACGVLDVVYDFGAGSTGTMVLNKLTSIEGTQCVSSQAADQNPSAAGRSDGSAGGNDPNVAAKGGDDHGNSCAAASAAVVGSTLNGVLAPNTDVDFFRFTLSGSATITAQADSQFDSFGRLYDANCTQIAEDDDGAGDPNRNFKLQRDLTAGTYFLQVSSFNGASGGGYAVALSSGGGGGGGGTGGVPLSGATSGTYISDGLRNHGFFLTVAPKPDGSNFIFYAWFTYDNEGVPTWLIGQQDIAANSASVSTNALAFTGAFPGGPRFLNFNDVAAMSSTRGTLNFTQRACGVLDVVYDFGSGSSGTMVLNKLTSIAGTQCQ